MVGRICANEKRMNALEDAGEFGKALEIGVELVETLARASNDPEDTTRMLWIRNSIAILKQKCGLCREAVDELRAVIADPRLSSSDRTLMQTSLVTALFAQADACKSRVLLGEILDLVESMDVGDVPYEVLKSLCEAVVFSALILFHGVSFRDLPFALKAKHAVQLLDSANSPDQLGPQCRALLLSQMSALVHTVDAGMLLEAAQTVRGVLRASPTHGADHPAAILCQGVAAAALWAQGELQRACEEMQEALDARIRTLGPNSNATWRFACNVAVFRQTKGEWTDEQAIEFLKPFENGAESS